MQTIPDAVLEKIAQHRPHLVTIIANIRQHPGHAPQLETQLANAYLAGETHLSAQETWHLAQVAYGGPWGGEWERATALAARLGVTEGRIRQRIAAGELVAVKRGKTWYVRRPA